MPACPGCPGKDAIKQVSVWPSYPELLEVGEAADNWSGFYTSPSSVKALQRTENTETKHCTLSFGGRPTDGQGMPELASQVVSNGITCLEGKRENYQVCSVQYCVQQLYTVSCTHIWTDLTVLWIGFCLTGPISLCLGSFLCMYIILCLTVYCMHVYCVVL